MNQNTKTNRSSGLILGAILILIGVIFLTQNLTDWDVGNWNWWALFILIPAFGSLANAWRIYQAEGRVPKMRGPLVGGFALLLVTVILLFDLDWGTMWPLFLIIVGVGALIVR